MRGDRNGRLIGGWTGWRRFWRRLKRRYGWGKRSAWRDAWRSAWRSAESHPQQEIRFLEVPKIGVIFPGVPVPEEALPGKTEGSEPPRLGQKVSTRRADTLLALVEEMGVRPADPAEGEVYLRAWLELTSRQKQVVCLACAGHTNREIAKRLRISPNTVKGHITLALGRFGLRSRAELRVALAGWDFSRWKAD